MATTIHDVDEALKELGRAQARLDRAVSQYYHKLDYKHLTDTAAMVMAVDDIKALTEDIYTLVDAVPPV